MPKKKTTRRRKETRIGKPSKTSEKSGFLVVGVGASAGGLKALQDLLGSLPAEPGLALILVQHLHPDHKSSLPQILSRSTKLPVTTAKHGMKIQANCVYVLPENASITLKDGALQIGARMETDGSHHPIDRFFSSLGEHCQSRCAGVVLSGAGSDGSLGLKALKAESGITFAQDPRSAIHSGMPQSAIDAGGVDFILSVEGIARELVRIAKHSYMNGNELQLSQTIPSATIDDPTEIFRLLRDATGIDFAVYKYSTIERRFRRRMAILKIQKLKDYAERLAQDTAELKALHRDIFIHVTQFFRDHRRFDALKDKIYGQILKKKSDDIPVRIWIPGCSTGEEAYSIAITWVEYIESISGNTSVQIFATDISDEAIRRARAGAYPKNIKAHVSSERLDRFFEKVDEGYRIKKSIRQMCVFARHDVISNPFFARLNLISCSNVLIYLERAAQKRVLSVFHHALSSSGFLLLGKSESTAIVSGLFRSVDQKNKIFVRKQVPSPNILPLHGMQSKIKTTSEVIKDRIPGFDLQREADRIVLTNYAPGGFLLDDKMNILQFRGQLSPFLEPSGEEASLNVRDMIRKELQWEIRALVREVKKSRAPIEKKNLTIQLDQKSKTVDLEVIPIRNRLSEDMNFLVLLKEPRDDAPAKNRTRKTDVRERVVAQLEEDLQRTTKRMQLLLEDQEEVNKELGAANEELQSTNEELESTNEELETTKEEMESTNEELTTLNEELQHRNDDLSDLNRQLTAARNYSDSIIRTVPEPLIVLNEHLRVVTANEAFYRAFQVRASETEHSSIYDLSNKKWDIPELRYALERVIAEKSSFEDYQIEADFPQIGRRIFSLNARRINQETGSEMILLAIQDVTHRKHSEEAAKTLVKEIHHRIKNNLQVISSLLSLQSRFAKDQESSALLRESENRVRSMSLIHEKLYQTSEAASVFFRDYVLDLTDNLFAFYNVDRQRVHTKIDVDEFYMSMDLAVPCGLIINELLSNVLKYAFPEERKGSIEIQMKRQKKSNESTTYLLRVKDDGVGLPKNFDLKKPRSLGMQIVSALSRQIGGELKLERKPGTSFNIRFAVPNEAGAIVQGKPL